MVTLQQVKEARERLELVGIEFKKTLGKQFALPYKREADLVDATKLFLTMLKPYAYTARNDAATIAGRPDLEVVICGQYVGIELKRYNGVRRATQIETAEEIIKAGGVCKQFKTIFELYSTLYETLEELYRVLSV